MEQIVNLVREVLNQKPMSAEEKLQLSKICELEDVFTKGFSKEKRQEYLNLDVEKGFLASIEVDEAILVTYNLCKKLFIAD